MLLINYKHILFIWYFKNMFVSLHKLLSDKSDVGCVRIKIYELLEFPLN